MSSSAALIDDMGVHDVGFLIENLGADAAPLQYLRELLQNELESIGRAGIDDGQIEIDYVEINGVRKLRITGNGEGMTPDEVADNLNRLSASGGVQAFDKNFGIGAKITAGTRNPHGVVYDVWKDGLGSTTVFGRIDGRYGRLGFRNEDDGTVDYWLPLPEDAKHPIIKQHGCSVVLLGTSEKEDTTVPPIGADLPSQWISAYLERRYFALPQGVSVRVLRPVEIFDSERNTHRSIYDTIRGQRYYLDRHSESRDTVALPEVNATVWWWLLNEDITKGGKTWNNSGHVAAIYQGEVYESRTRGARTSALKDFGIYAGFGRIVIYVEPHDVLKANTPRTSLILQGNRPIDYAAIGAAFIDKMPAELDRFMAGQVTAEHGDHRKAIRKTLKEVEDALDEARFRRSQRGKLDHYDPEPGGSEARSMTDGSSREESGRGRAEDAGGRIGSEYLRRAREERERRNRGEQIDADPSPKIVWDESGTATQAGRAATYNPRVHVVTANPKFAYFLDLMEWGLEEARQRAASEMDEATLRAIVEDEAKRWFEQALAEVVIVLRPMAHDTKWGPMVYESALSEEGLTAAIVSHRWHMMTAIKRGLAGRLGRSKEAVA